MKKFLKKMKFVLDMLLRGKMAVTMRVAAFFCLVENATYQDRLTVVPSWENGEFATIPV